jgi:hypothetical protein
MKRLLLCVFIIVALMAIWYGQSRKFFCLHNGKCVTVWKTYNNVCYIVPGKYYGILKPSDNFIETSNTNQLMIFFTTELPKAFIFKSEQELKIINNNKDEIVFYNYRLDTAGFDKRLYMPNAKLNSDLKDNSALMYVFIHDNYAMDKSGKHL